MGDSYHPSYGPSGVRRDDRNPRLRQNDRYDRYSPPPPARHYRDDRRDEYRDSGFSFRGAAGGQADNYRPPQQRSEFTFRAPGDSRALAFPNAPPPQRSQPLPSRPRQDRNQRARRGGRPGPPRRFAPKAAHDRAILKYKEEESTPDQLVGMNGDTQPKYVEVISSDDESDAEDDNGEEASRKRAKTDTAAAELERPKWSNPDPYSALPPTDMGLGPKKDIVQTIRKAKNDALAQKNGSNAIKENVDFISFDMDEDKPDDADEEDDDDSSEGDDDDLVGAPPAPPSGLVMPTDEELMDAYAGTATGKGKRKRGAEPSASAGLIVDEWKPNGTNPTPWVPRNAEYQSNVGLQLHKEIIDFYDYVQPRSYEENCRRDLVDRLQQAITSFRNSRHVQLRTFGSFASGLYLPTADMDLVAVSSDYMQTGRKTFCQNKNHMHSLGRHLQNCGVVKAGTLAIIAKAKVPIVKFVDARTGIKVDISFENATGITAIPTLCGWKEQYPQMPILVALIKQFLAMRGLNEVFSGGIGGFTIICLVTNMLQLKPEMQSNSADVSYGELLMDFFDLYGNKFDLTATGILMNPPGYFRKGIDPVHAKLNATGLSIIDPNRADNDISGGSREVVKVFQHFRGAFSQIQRRLNQIRNGDGDHQSILGCIIGGNYTSFENQRTLLYRLGGSGGRGGHDGRGGYDGDDYDDYDDYDHYEPRSRQSRQQAPRPPPPAAQYYNSYGNHQQYPSLGYSNYSNQNQSQYQPAPSGYAAPQSYPPPQMYAPPQTYAPLSHEYGAPAAGNDWVAPQRLQSTSQPSKRKQLKASKKNSDQPVVGSLTGVRTTTKGAAKKAKKSAKRGLKAPGQSNTEEQKRDARKAKKQKKKAQRQAVANLVAATQGT